MIHLPEEQQTVFAKQDWFQYEINRDLVAIPILLPLQASFDATRTVEQGVLGDLPLSLEKRSDTYEK